MKYLRSLPKWLKIAIPASLALLILLYVAIGWYFSSKLLLVTPQKVEYDRTVVSVSNGTYVLAGNAYNVSGVMGIEWPGGPKNLVASAPNSIVDGKKESARRILRYSGEGPKQGDKVALIGTVFTTNPKDALGLDYQEIKYDTLLGPASAWVIPATSSRWMVAVHGIGASKTEFLRFAKAIHEADVNLMIINYRGDADAPASPDGFAHLGDTEWEDVEAAVRYASTKGAEEVQLFGISFGGSLVQNYLRRSTDVQQLNITRVVLDSPALDWDQILSYRLTKDGYPSIMMIPGKQFAAWRSGIDFDRVTTAGKSDLIKHKTLIFHTVDDTSVPQSASKTLAEQQPQLVKVLDFGKGGHTRSWNHDQIRYEEQLIDFLVKGY